VTKRILTAASLLGALTAIGLAGAWFVKADEAHDDVQTLKQIHVEQNARANEAEARRQAQQDACLEGLISREWCLKKGYEVPQEEE